MSEGKDRLLAQMKDAEGAVYALISGYTKEPYVECDGETYDDKVFVYLSEDAAKARVTELKEEKIPVGVAKILSNHMLLFFTNLYTMGVNALEIHYDDKMDLLQIDEFAKRRENPQVEEGKQWIENPQLHLTALYFMQEMRRQEKPELTEELKGLQEEILVNYGRGRFIVAVHKENGMPMLKQKNGDAYQPIFTDILEFRKFNKEDQFKTMAIEAKNVPKMLVNEAKGVVINPYGVNLQIPIVRPEEPQEKK